MAVGSGRVCEVSEMDEEGGGQESDMIIGLINLNDPLAWDDKGRVKQEYLNGALVNMLVAMGTIGVSAAPKNLVIGGGFHYLTYRKWSPSMTVEKADKWRKKQWEKWAPPKRLPVRLRLVKTDE